MKAIRIYEHGCLDSLVVDDIDEPKIDPNKIIVKIKASSINHLDIWVRNGLPSLPIPLPLILGSDAAGEVVDVGINIEDYKIGDKVVVQPGTYNQSFKDIVLGSENFSKSYGILGETEDGVHAEYVSLSKENIALMPSHLSFEEAASMQLVFMTSYQMLTKRAKLKKNEFVLIYGGSSGVGSAAIQIAKDIGSIVIATAGNEEKEKHSYKMGADYVIDHYDSENFLSKIKEITNNKLCDVVFEHVGESTWDVSLKSLAKGGRLVTCGSTTGPNVKIDLRHLFMKQQSIIGSTMAGLDSFNEVMSKIKNKTFIPFIDKIFKFHDIKRAHQYIENSNQIGKIILLP